MALTDKELKKKLVDIQKAHKDDIEFIHLDMDNVIMELLDDLGYHESVNEFNNTIKWYA